MASLPPNRFTGPTSLTQKAKTEFAQFNDGAEMSAPKAGGTVTVQGKSNSKILTFAWVGTVEDVAIPQSYTANGSPATNGAEITGDPGAANEYDFSLSLAPSGTLIFTSLLISVSN